MHEAESPENLPSSPSNTDGDHPYALFQNRDFRLYLAGRLVAVLGQQMFALALGWEIYDAHRFCRWRWASWDSRK